MVLHEVKRGARLALTDTTLNTTLKLQSLTLSISLTVNRICINFMNI